MGSVYKNGCVIAVQQVVLVCTVYKKQTYGSGVYMGLDPCLIYWVLWNTRKARPAKKSREERRPATGLREKPVQSGKD